MKLKDTLVAVVAYKRPKHLFQCLTQIKKGLSQNNNLVVKIFFDYDEKKSAEWEETFSVIKNSKFEFFANKTNKGLRENIFSVLSFFYNSEYSKLILIEDDIIISDSFFKYFDYMFDKYQNDNNIFQISGFSILNKDQTFFGLYPRISTWGWGTWKTKFPDPNEVKINWDSFKLKKAEYEIYNKFMPDVIKLIQLQSNGEINAWSLDFLYYMVKNDLKTIYPGKSLVRNIGFDGSGENCGNSKPFFDFEFFWLRDKHSIDAMDKFEFPNKLIPNSIIKNKFLKYYSPNILNRVLTKIIGL